PTTRKTWSTWLPLVLAAALLGAACGTDERGASGPGTDSTTAATSTAYPVTVENCGAKVTFDEPPKRVILLESAPVTILQGLGVLDSVVLRAGAFPKEYYDDETNAAIDAIPSLG